MGRKVKKIQVTACTSERLSKYDLEGAQEAVIQRINQAFADARLVASVGELYLDWTPKQWDDGEDLYVYVRREETDAERDKRMAATNMHKRQVEERERKLLEDLQKKYLK